MAYSNVIAAMNYHHAILEVCGPLTVQAIFSRAWHLRHSQGWVISVATTPFDGPLGIRVAESALDSLLVRPGMPACLASNELQIGRVCIDLSEAAVWQPQGFGSPLPLRTKRLHEAVYALSGPLTPGAFQAGYPRAGGGEWTGAVGTDSPPLPKWVLGFKGMTPQGENILSALMNNDVLAIEQETYALLGRGPGLTPAGDDFLCGLLVGLQVIGIRLPDVEIWSSDMLQCIGGIVDQHAATRTTALSRTLLRYAREGVAMQPLLDVVRTLGGDCPVVGLKELIAIGHSSGRAMLAGAILAFRAAMERERVLGPALVRPA